MNNELALGILKALADGINPHAAQAGEPLPADSVYQHPNTVRALFHAIEAIEALKSAGTVGTATELAPGTSVKKPARTSPVNTGKPWTKDDDAQLLAAFDASQPVDVIARTLARSRLAIEARLAKFGRMPMPAGVRVFTPIPAAADEPTPSTPMPLRDRAEPQYLLA